jgi:sirohydrochlorin ferrochelatase
MQMHQALIVAHGQPSDPLPAALALKRLARAVAGQAPGWAIGAATLADPAALPAQLAALGPQGLVYPMFMADGWFTRSHLPKRLAEAGGGQWRVLDPFGIDPAVQALALKMVAEAGLQAGGALLVAAHGSFRSPAPAAVARALAHEIGRALHLGRAEAAFIDQEPQLANVRNFGKDALCLPFFAAEGGHVRADLPLALAQAGFAGRVLPALGLDQRVPGLIAARLIAASRA